VSGDGIPRSLSLVGLLSPVVSGLADRMALRSVGGGALATTLATGTTSPRRAWSPGWFHRRDGCLSSAWRTVFSWSPRISGHV